MLLKKSKIKIIPPVLVFRTEENRRYAVEQLFKDFEYCGVPYIALLITDVIDAEYINTDRKTTQKYLDAFIKFHTDNNIDFDYMEFSEG